MSKNQVITLNRLSNITETKPIIWKDLGTYIDKKLIIEPKLDEELFEFDIKGVNTLINYKICDHCSRPIGIENLKTHYPKCLEMRVKKQNQPNNTIADDDVPLRKRKKDLEPSSVDSSRNNTPMPTTPNARPKKKYKKSQTQKEKEAANAAAAAAATNGGITTGDKMKKPKKTKTTKQVGKQKGPVDVEKQCGVALPNGGYCARSLTCKTHSMGAKRAVPGRSAPYDVLLQQYQKRNQAKIAATNALALQKKEIEQYSSVNEELNPRILDPNEETYLVLEGLSKNQPIPLERKIILPTRNRHRFLYMRESYANALIINGNQSQNQSNSNDQTLANQAISGSIGGLQGRTALVDVDSKRIENDSLTQSLANIAGEMYQVRAPSKEILSTAHYNNMQQQMFQQQMIKLQQQQQLKKRQQEGVVSAE